MTDRPRLLEMQFEELLAKCLTPDQILTMDPAQRTDLRRFFMAGALAYGTTIMVNAEGGDDVTDNDMALMDALETELRLFGDDVAAGRA
jgi:hypothetical protein